MADPSQRFPRHETGQVNDGPPSRRAARRRRVGHRLAVGWSDDDERRHRRLRSVLQQLLAETGRLPTGAVLCLSTIPFLLVHSLHQLLARHRSAGSLRLHLVNAVLSATFLVLALTGDDETPVLVLLRLWSPIVFYWWAYLWAGHNLHTIHPPGRTYDRAIIALEGRLLSQPSAWLASRQPAWLNELMHIFYFSYYFYTPLLALVLQAGGRLQQFEAMALAVNIGYALCYSIYPWTPVWGPRWALVDEDLLKERDRILDGFAITRFMNALAYSKVPHKGGAMPSAHSSTAIVFAVWCWRIWGGSGDVWGTAGGLLGVAIATGMLISTVYCRHHYVLDAVVGSALGAAALLLADALITGSG